MAKLVMSLKRPEILLDQNAPVPLYRQLYERLRGSILAGQLEAGTRLPSTRVLASSLGVSRTTTALAYELLLLEGYLESRVGDGTRVARLQPEQLFQRNENAQGLDASDTAETPPPAFARRGQALIEMPYPEGFYGEQARRGKNLFLVGQPDVTSFPYETWARLLARHAHRRSIEASTASPRGVFGLIALIEHEHSLFRQELGIPGDFPDMLIWILEIASIPSIERLLCRFDDRCPCCFGLLHHQVDFFFAADILGQGKFRRTWSLNREMGIVSNASSWPKSKLDPVL